MVVREQPPGGGVGPFHEVRLPLQVGTTSLWSLARAGAAFVPAASMVVLSVVIDRAFDGWGNPPVWPQDAALGVGGLLGLYALAHVRYAWRERPSDIVLDPRGIRVEGGRHGGAWARWEALNREACRVEVAVERRLTLRGIALSTLMLFRRDPADDVEVSRLVVVAWNSHPQILARAENASEARSLHALLDSVRSGPWGRPIDEATHRRAAEARRRQAALGIRIVECPSCGAPVPPVESAATTCRHCGAEVPIEPDMIRRLEASRRVVGGRATIQSTVRRLLAQPDADAIAMRLAAAGAAAFSMGLVAMGLLGWRASSETATLLDVLLLPFLPLLIVVGIFAFLRRAMVDRQALRLLTTDFAAHAPLRPGDPHTCRNCMGPLPERGDEIAVRCVYCSADNVLGSDLGHDVAPTEHQAATLEEAMHLREREAQRWDRLRWGGAVAIGLAWLGVASGAGLSSAWMKPLGAKEPGAARYVRSSSPEQGRPRFDAFFAPFRREGDPLWTPDDSTVPVTEPPRTPVAPRATAPSVPSPRTPPSAAAAPRFDFVPKAAEIVGTLLEPGGKRAGVILKLQEDDSGSCGLLRGRSMSFKLRQWSAGTTVALDGLDPSVGDPMASETWVMKLDPARGPEHSRDSRRDRSIAWRPTGTIRIEAAPLRGGETGRIVVDLHNGSFHVGTTLPVRICLPLD
jgi:hypothetical protein